MMKTSPLPATTAPRGVDISLINRLNDVGLRPTRQRLALAELLFANGHRHITAEQLFDEARRADQRVSLATVYNTLNQFADAGLLHAVTVDQGRTYFDTNVTDHHHFFFEDSGELTDIPADAIKVVGKPKPPAGYEIDDIQVVVRVKRKA